MFGRCGGGHKTSVVAESNKSAGRVLIDLAGDLTISRKQTVPSSWSRSRPQRAVRKINQLDSCGGNCFRQESKKEEERGIAPLTVIDSPALRLKYSNHSVFGRVAVADRTWARYGSEKRHTQQFSLTYFSTRHIPQNGRLGVNQRFPASVSASLPLRVFCQSFCQNMLI